MNFKQAVVRARRGLREERRLYLIAVSSLTIAFFCVGGVLFALSNLSAAATRWGDTGRMSVYLSANATDGDVSQLRMVLEALPEVEEVEHLRAEVARARFIEESEGGEFSALPIEAFPASLEVSLSEGFGSQKAEEIAERVSGLSAVDEVETYRGWFARLESLMNAGQGLALFLALLVGLCVLAVVGNTIRLAVARRREEIEVLKLCGATDSFVRGPFVLEGTFQGLASATLAVVLLMGAFLLLRDRIEASLGELVGADVVFIDGPTVLLLLAAGAVVGALGSALSVRRYLAV